MNKTTLLIGDGHVMPEDQDGRWLALGQLIAVLQPDCIVQIGDFLTYDSISAWNASKRLSMEGQRLKAEMEAGQRAYADLMLGINTLNEGNRRNRKALYKPVMYWLDGNHENRAERYCELHPEMDGLVNYRYYFDPVEDGWILVPYRMHSEYMGVMHTHIPMNGNNQPQSSKHIIKNVIKDYSCPVVFGHTHKLGFESDGVLGTDGAKRVTALNVGCFFSHIPGYADGSRSLRDWWAGVCILHHTNDQGDYDLETISLERILA